MLFENGLAKTIDNYENWWAGELDRPLIPIVLTGLKPDRKPPKHYYENQKSYGDPKISPEEFVDSADYELRSCEYLGDSYPFFNGIHSGPGIVAAFLGADVNIDTGSIWFFPKKELPLEELHFEYDENNFWLQRTKAILMEAKSRWGDTVVIGMPDLGGVIDILATFRGTQNLLFDLYDSPDEVKRNVNDIKILWHRYFDELLLCLNDGLYTDWGGILSKSRIYMMQSDFSYMLGPDLFKEFVLDELTETCAFLDRGCYHLDGVGQIPFIESLIEDAKMDLIQWVPGDGPYADKDWFELYVKILDSDKHLQLAYDDDFTVLDKLISRYGSGKNIVRHTIRKPFTERDAVNRLLSRYNVTDC